MSDSSTSSTDIVASLRKHSANLHEDQHQAQELFRSVASYLESETLHFDEHHAVREEWAKLSEEYQRLYRESREHAGDCLDFLNMYTDIIVPLSQSRLTVDERNSMLKTFIEKIQAHRHSAGETAEKLSELSRKVDHFPQKVTAALQRHAQQQSLWNRLLLKLKGLYEAITKAVQKLVMVIVRMLPERINLPGGGYIELFVSYMRLEEYDMTPSPENCIRDDCESLSGKLSYVAFAWRAMEQACAALRNNVDMAKCHTDIPDIFDAHMEMAEPIFTALKECMQEYTLLPRI
ncbi:hypothetical protein WOLCODRAFT_140161 [Wolfiporia cocos MD-104 SS10]|uniref:Uncharacterized protein n=1 Tax=Wolfiporia cocos (strain MD-104) TaxID=742152 RepID=A0A2H3J1Y2_WOLCO|nr:hypothetical protein WOLCODRAFT_140161 [Wolfiporia cocos MD-104 SS10]